MVDTYTARGPAPATMLASILQGKGLNDSGWEIVLGKSRRLDGTTVTPVQGSRGAKVENQIVLYDDSGRPSDPKWNIDYPAVHIEVWGGVSVQPMGTTPMDPYNTAYNRAHRINEALLGADPIDVTLPTSTTRIVSILLRGDIMYLGISEQDRPVFTLNYDLITHPYWNPSPSPGDSQFGRRQVM